MTAGGACNRTTRTRARMLPVLQLMLLAWVRTRSTTDAATAAANARTAPLVGSAVALPLSLLRWRVHRLSVAASLVVPLVVPPQLAVPMGLSTVLSLLPSILPMILPAVATMLPTILPPPPLPVPLSPLLRVALVALHLLFGPGQGGRRMTWR